MGVKLVFFSLSGKHKLKMSDNMEFRAVFIPKRQVGERYIMMSLMVCTLHQILLR